MKSCPTCNRTYADETMTYCVADGSLLSAPYNPEMTRRIPSPRITNAQTEVFPTNATRPEAVSPNRISLSTYIIIALLALILGGGVVALLKSGEKDNRTAEPPAANTANISNISSASTVSTPKGNPETEVKPNPTNSPPTSTTKQLSPPSGGVWFVILGSFPKNDYETANQRLQYVRGLGYDASIIDTDNYPGLRDGLWSVVMGPYSKSYAMNVAAQMKSVRSDAYIKSGW
jgi:cell division septation protein DedD